jgi:hypothetical protein
VNAETKTLASMMASVASDKHSNNQRTLGHTQWKQLKMARNFGVTIARLLEGP